MKKWTRTSSIVLLAALATAAPAAAGQEAPQPARSPRAGEPRPAQGVGHGTSQAPGPGVAPVAPSAAAPDYVEREGFKSAVFEVRHRDPGSLLAVLRPLASGFRGATVAASRDFNTISVRDFPENIATIEAAIKRLDTPQPPRTALDLRLHVLLASPGAATGAEGLPAEIRPAVTQLQAAFNYKGLKVLTPIVQRVMEGHEPTFGSGQVADPLRTAGPGGHEPIVSYRYQIGAILRSTDDSGRARYVLERFEFQMGGAPAGTRIGSDISLREGEHVVVGTAAFAGQALVLVLSLGAAK